jgi:acyl-CoA hydrolase
MTDMEQFRWVQGWHMNSTNILFGGQMLSWADEDTAMLAHEACVPGCRLTTGGFDRVSFITPCHHGDRLRFCYTIVHLGNKSMTILAKVYRRWSLKEKEDFHPEALAFECLVTMVCLNGPIKEWCMYNIPPSGYTPLIEKLRKEREPLG